MTNEYEALDESMRSCRKCADMLAGKCVNPLTSETRVVVRPIVSGIRQKPVMLIGQAPGITEYESGKPFQGPAGQEMRDLFDNAGIPRSQFDTLVYSAAVVKCFPGSKKVANRRKPGFRREDEVPSTAMVRNCQPFFTSQIRLADPAIIVTLGGFPLKAYLRLTGRRPSDARLEAFVGKKEMWQGRTIIFFPHTSGASRWLNSANNKALFERAKKLLRDEIADRKCGAEK